MCDIPNIEQYDGIEDNDDLEQALALQRTKQKVKRIANNNLRNGNPMKARFNIIKDLSDDSS